MSNAETVQDIYAAFGDGDLERLLGQLADDVRWDHWDDNAGQRAGVPWLQARTGRDEVSGFFEALGALDFHDLEVTELLEGPEQVAVLVRIDATVKDTGAPLQDEELHLWTFGESGKVVAMCHYLDTAKHIAAVRGADAVTA